MNDEGQDYMKGYGDGYSRACEDILKAIVEKKKKQENSWKDQPFRENEKTFGVFLDVPKVIFTTPPGVSQNTTPTPITTFRGANKSS